MHPARGFTGYFFATAANRSLAASQRAGDLRLSGNKSGGAQDNDKRGATSPKERRRDKSNVVGRALRTVYDETLREDVPSDFLDLLGKLG